MKNKFLILSIIFFSFLSITSLALASTSDGTIDPTYKYAWGENVGFIDFGSEIGNVHITDGALSGYAYGENIGWINLSSVINDGEGNLSGYAWGENVGFIDFSKAKIGEDGIFSGSLYGENIGWIIFGETTNKVVTDWRPESSRSSNSSHSRVIGSLPKEKIITQTKVLNTLPTQIISSISGSRILKLTNPYMKGIDIKELQTYLNSKGYNSGIPDGVFGKLTKNAVILFQKANNLTSDGIVGPITRSKLQ